LRGSFEEYFEFSGRSRAVVVALCLWCGSGGYRNFNGTWIWIVYLFILFLNTSLIL
jgi:hypothetical protein